MRLCPLGIARPDIRAIALPARQADLELAARWAWMKRPSSARNSNENPGSVKDPRRHGCRRWSISPAIPDGNGFELKAALCRRHGVAIRPDRRRQRLQRHARDGCRRLPRPPSCGRLRSQHAFAVYPLATQAAGAKGIQVPAATSATTRRHAGDHAQPRVVFIANPTTRPVPSSPAPSRGLPRPRARPRAGGARRGLHRIPRAGPALRRDRLDPALPNLLVSRTFSKAYGLAGLRGLAEARQPAVIDLLNRVRASPSTSIASASLRGRGGADDDFLQRSFRLPPTRLACASSPGASSVSASTGSLGPDRDLQGRRRRHGQPALLERAA